MLNDVPRERKERDEKIISLILHIIRNLLSIKDAVGSNYASTDNLEKSTLQVSLCLCPLWCPSRQRLPHPSPVGSHRPTRVLALPSSPHHSRLLFANARLQSLQRPRPRHSSTPIARHLRERTLQRSKDCELRPVRRNSSHELMRAFCRPSETPSLLCSSKRTSSPRTGRAHPPLATLASERQSRFTSTATPVARWSSTGQARSLETWVI